MDRERRKTLALLGGGLAAGLMGPSVVNWVSKTDTKGAPSARGSGDRAIHEPLPYVKLDPEHVGELGYRYFYQGDCMYGVFGAIVDALAEEVGEPFASYPTTVTRYGAAGVMGWGTLCGSANGAAMAIYLVSKDPAPAINEVFAFYEREALPNFLPVEARFQVPGSVAGSTLCHVSISKWCDFSGYDAYSAERADRCAQVAASLAKHTVEVLNAQLDGSFTAIHRPGAAELVCLGCHGRDSALQNMRGMMYCATCHTDKLESHP
ncbi:MAG: C_GCAxxG_C_C family protein [Gemmatimonadota bacterium]|nr:MAG: C_GCAxxG_C_C family protein [Gemmatimonadota bacterium]